MEKQILGYKLIKLEYTQACKNIIKDNDWFERRWERNLNEKGYNFGNEVESPNSVGGKLTKAGVMHWFEPVYEEESQTWKKGEWLYFKGFLGSEYLFRLNSILEAGNIKGYENYKIEDDKVKINEVETYSPTNSITKATPDQIQRILTIVAKHKGFVEGVKVNQKPAFNGKGNILTIGIYESKYHNTDTFSIGGVGIYSKGKWAEVVKEPKFKIGDHICKNYGLDKKVYIITHVTEHELYIDNDIRGFFRQDEIRLATPEEIAEATKPKLPRINSYDGHFEGNHVIYGCAKMHIDFFLDTFNVNNYQGSNRKLKGIILDSDVHISLEQMKQITEAYRKQ